MKESEDSYKFRKRNRLDTEWLEWTGAFPTEEKAKEWYDSPFKGGYFLGKGYKLGLFLHAVQVFPNWI